MDKKISSTFAITVIAIISIFLTLFIWLSSTNQNGGNKAREESEASKAKGTSEKKCRRMFEGDTAVSAWLAEKSEAAINGKETIIKIVPEDIDKLPLPEEVADRENFELKLVDADQQLIKKLEKASQKNPAEVKIKGYKYFCNQMHLVSTKSASESLKKI